MKKKLKKMEYSEFIDYIKRLNNKKFHPQESWDIRFDKVLLKEMHGDYVPKSCPECEKRGERLKSFIRTLLEAQKKEWMDVSSWKNLGEKYGYFKFFEKKIKKEIIEEIEKMKAQKLKEFGEYETDWMGLVDEIIKRLSFFNN